jgi:hypothetical protein
MLMRRDSMVFIDSVDIRILYVVSNLTRNGLENTPAVSERKEEGLESNFYLLYT